MTRSVKPWVRRTALPLLAFVGLSTAPLVRASELAPPAVPSPAVTEAKPVTAATTAKLASLDTSEAAFATTATTQTTEPAAGDSQSFFKSPKGVLAAVLAAAGVGYVIYSSHNDRIKSPIR